MSSKNFNEELKRKEANANKSEENGNGKIALDDAQRVKILSPGRLVFKRFIRNKLAIVGTCILIAMFVYSFLIPVFYAYGQAEKFWKYEKTNGDYAYASVVKDYTNYYAEGVTSDDVARSVRNNMNSFINEMEKNGLTEKPVSDEEGNDYLVKKLGDYVYVLLNDSSEVGLYSGKTMFCNFTTIAGGDYSFGFDNPGDGFEEAVKNAINDKTMTLSFNEMNYLVEAGSVKMSYVIYLLGKGSISYTSTNLGDDFLESVHDTVIAGEDKFTFGEKEYRLAAQSDDSFKILEIVDDKIILISAKHVFDMYDSSKSREITPQLKFLAYECIYQSKKFSYENANFEIKNENNLFVLYKNDEAYAQLSLFAVRSPSGEDSFNIEFKKTIEEYITNLKPGDYTQVNSFKYMIQQRSIDEINAIYDADGNLVYQIVTVKENDEEKEVWCDDDEKPVEVDSDGNPVIEAGTAMFDAEKKQIAYGADGKLMLEAGSLIFNADGSPVLAEEDLLVLRKNEDFTIQCEEVRKLIDRYAAPSSTHLMGTDDSGYDVLARTMYGGRISLMVGFVVVIIETILGVILGGIAGYFGGWVDNLIMRLVDIFYCIPSMPILIIIGAMFDQLALDDYVRLAWLMAILGFLGWAGVARLVRGQILSLREQEFMVAAEATGLGTSKRIFRHLVPNVMPQLIVSATMGLGGVIITESTLSFLGLGVKHPLATWGTMINAVTGSIEAMTQYAYIWIPVGLFICLAVIAFNFVGDGLRDAFDPKMKR